MSAQQDPTGVDVPTKTLYLTENQVKDYNDDINAIESSLRDPRARLDDRPAVIRQLNNIKRDLETQRPPEVRGDKLDAVAREEAALRNEISGVLLSAEEMRKCPPGAIGHERAVQDQYKHKIIRWKNLRRILFRGSDDPDVSNVEALRPRTNRLNLDNALIPGKQHFVPPNDPQYQDNFDRTFKQGAYAEDAEPQQAPAQQGEVEALLQKVAKLEAALGDQSADTTERGTGELFHAQSKCGKEFKASKQHFADNGRRAHERACKKCKEIPEA